MVYFIFLCLVASSLMIPAKFILLMIQQNRYEIARYQAWFKSHRREVLKENMTTIILMIASLLALFAPSYYPMIIIGFMIFIKVVVDVYVEAKKTYIKPLNVTKRVLRQIALIIVLDGVWFYLCFQWIDPYFYVLVLWVSLWMNQGLILLAIYMLQPLEKFFHHQFKKQGKKKLKEVPHLEIIGITGSYGKTSSKNILQEILSSKYYSLMTPASFNTPMGITITIKNHLTRLHEVFICEMGADHVGDIEELMNFVEPNIGIVTSIGPQHLNTFKSIENIIQEKMKAIEMLPSTGVGIINMDNDYIRAYQVKNHCRLVRVAIDHEEADLRATNIEYSPHGSTFVVNIKGQPITFETKLLGKHNIMNILVSIAVGLEMGVSPSDLKLAVKRCNYVEHRLELKKINGYTFIDNAFNSNPQGAAMSLEVLSRMPAKRLIITPGMIDLGEQQESLNYQFGTQMLGKVDTCILVGKQQTQSIYQGLSESGFDMEQVILTDTVAQAFQVAYRLAGKEDVILLENDMPDAFNH